MKRWRCRVGARRQQLPHGTSACNFDKQEEACAGLSVCLGPFLGPRDPERMDLFADFERKEERAAIARLVQTADSAWLAGVGVSLPQDMAGRKSGEDGGEPADADHEIEALEAHMVASAGAATDSPVRLTMQLIRESVRLGADAMAATGIHGIPKPRREDDGDDDGDDEASELLRKKILRLDWLNIGRIENLDAFTHVQELYLQHNLLECVENLDDHTELRFLALAGNRIRKIEGLRHLDKVRSIEVLIFNIIEHGTHIQKNLVSVTASCASWTCPTTASTTSTSVSIVCTLSLQTLRVLTHGLNACRRVPAGADDSSARWKPICEAHARVRTAAV
jgi:hypothetical protein